MKTNNIRFTVATCPICGRECPSTDERTIFDGVRGSKLYVHDNCVTMDGDAVRGWNDNGGSVHYFHITMWKPFDSKVEALNWFMFLRSTGFRGNVRNNGTHWTVYAVSGKSPAQSVKRLLKNVKPMSFSLNFKPFSGDEMDNAMRYIQRITKGNSHNGE